MPLQPYIHPVCPAELFNNALSLRETADILARAEYTWHISRVSLKHDGTDGSDGTGIQSVSPIPSASMASPSVPSVSNSRRKLTNWFVNSRKHLTWETGVRLYCVNTPFD